MGTREANATGASISACPADLSMSANNVHKFPMLCKTAILPNISLNISNKTKARRDEKEQPAPRSTVVKTDRASINADSSCHGGRRVLPRTK